MRAAYAARFAKPVPARSLPGSTAMPRALAFLRFLVLPGAVALGASLGSAGVAAQAPWPGAEPIRLVVCAPGGSTVDITARLWAEALRTRLNQTVVVEAKPGAGGMIGVEAVARARPDGYTLGVCFPGSFTMIPHLRTNLPVNPLQDLRPVALLATAPFVFAADAKVATSLDGFLAAARAGDLNYASVGQGSLAQLGMELFLQKAGVRLTHVPYPGSPQAITDMLGGRVAAFITPLSAVGALIEQGRVAALFTTGPQRLPQLPQVPSAAEAGFPDLTVVTWHGLFAPRGTPDPVVAKLGAAVLAAAREDLALREGLARAGSDVPILTTDETEALILEESRLWGGVIQAAGIKAE